jgi:hypothetical protein
MVGQVPQSRPPAYGEKYAAQEVAFDANNAARMGDALDTQSKNFGHLTSNIKDIAGVSGGMMLDEAMRRYAGQKDGVVFSNEYAGMADRLRLAQSAADIKSTGREHRAESLAVDNKGIFVEVFGPDGKSQGVQPVGGSDELMALDRILSKDGKTYKHVSNSQVDKVTSATKNKGSAETPVMDGSKLTTPAPSTGKVPTDSSSKTTNSIDMEAYTGTRLLDNGDVEYFDQGTQQWKLYE